MKIYFLRIRSIIVFLLLIFFSLEGNADVTDSYEVQLFVTDRAITIYIADDGSFSVRDLCIVSDIGQQNELHCINELFNFLDAGAVRGPLCLHLYNPDITGAQVLPDICDDVEQRQSRSIGFFDRFWLDDNQLVGELGWGNRDSVEQCPEFSIQGYRCTFVFPPTPLMTFYALSGNNIIRLSNNENTIIFTGMNIINYFDIAPDEEVVVYDDNTQIFMIQRDGVQIDDYETFPDVNRILQPQWVSENEIQYLSVTDTLACIRTLHRNSVSGHTESEPVCRVTDQLINAFAIELDIYLLAVGSELLNLSSMSISSVIYRVNDDERIVNISVANDGQIALIIEKSDGKHDLVVINQDGSNSITIVQEIEPYGIVWSADYNKLYFVKAVGLDTLIHIYDFSTQTFNPHPESPRDVRWINS